MQRITASMRMQNYCISIAEDSTALLLSVQVVPLTTDEETAWGLSAACSSGPFSCPGGTLPYAGVGTYRARGPENAACVYTPEHSLRSG
jgi:hypothetical protein